MKQKLFIGKFSLSYLENEINFIWIIKLYFCNHFNI